MKSPLLIITAILILFTSQIFCQANLDALINENASDSDNISSDTENTLTQEAGTDTINIGVVDSSIRALNFRDAPWGNIIGVILSGETIEIIGDSDNPNWILVNHKGREGYVYRSYIQTLTGQTNTSESRNGTVSGCSYLNVRNSEWGTVIGGLRQNSSVRIFRTRNNWHEIEYNGQRAWISGRYVTVNSDIEENNSENTNDNTPPIVPDDTNDNENSNNNNTNNINEFEKIVTDRNTGYRLWILCPQNYNGTADLYFPGDGSGIDRVRSLGFLQKAQNRKIEKGYNSAVIIVEGRRASINAEKSQRYSALRTRGKFTSIVETLETELTVLNKIHIIGHSRAGSAIYWIAHNNEKADKLKMISCLDGSYSSLTNLHTFAQNGGMVNIAYKLNSPTAGQADNLRRLSPFSNADTLTGFEKERDHYTGVNDKIHIHAGTYTHGEYPATYSEYFMTLFSEKTAD